MTISEKNLRVFRQLSLARLAEERIQKEYFKDEMKTPVHLGIGAEAIAVGVVETLPAGTKYFGTYRNHNLFLSLTGDTDSFFAELYGKATGCAKGKAGSMHMSSPERGLMMTSAVVATTIPVAVGAAFASRYSGENLPAAVFFGDGATEEGVFFESLNFAALHKLKVVFVCEDNELAIHTFKKERQGYRSLKDVAEAFGCAYFEGDGRDVQDVMRVSNQALAALENGPVVLKFDYFRFLQHVGPLKDFDAGYREEPVDAHPEQDPIAIYTRALEKAGASASELEAVRAEVNRQIDRSIEKARAAPYADASELTSDVYAGGGNA